MTLKIKFYRSVSGETISGTIYVIFMDSVGQTYKKKIIFHKLALLLAIITGISIDLKYLFFAYTFLTKALLFPQQPFYNFVCKRY